MSNEETIAVIIVDPNRVVFEGKATRLFLPGKMAELAVLPHHAPLYSELIKGTIHIEEETGKEIKEEIEGGVARIKNNSVTILVGF